MKKKKTSSNRFSQWFSSVPIPPWFSSSMPSRIGHLKCLRASSWQNIIKKTKQKKTTWDPVEASKTVISVKNRSLYLKNKKKQKTTAFRHWLQLVAWPSGGPHVESCDLHGCPTTVSLSLWLYHSTDIGPNCSRNKNQLFNVKQFTLQTGSCQAIYKMNAHLQRLNVTFH